MPNLSKILGVAALATSIVLGGCTTSTRNPNLPTGLAAYDVVPATVEAPTFYEIKAGDLLSVRVFGEADLSTDRLRVDNVGFIQLPLIGQIKASGLSAPDLSSQIAEALRKSYLVDPKVNVSVVQAAPIYASVEGEVKKPGTYEIRYDTTLMGAIARAESPALTAKLDNVVIFRTLNGQRLAGRFNLKDIRGGVAPDPIVMDGDVIMVGHSPAKGAWQDFLRAAPVFNIFAVLGTSGN